MNRAPWVRRPWAAPRARRFGCGILPLLAGATVALAALPGAASTAEAPAPFLRTLEQYKGIHAAHAWVNNRPISPIGQDEQEVELQFSFRKALGSGFHAAYTQRTIWQVYDRNRSRPIRENNYNPELFLEVPDLWGADTVRFGLFEHESNGRQRAYNAAGQPVNFSRTWNRVYLFMEKARWWGPLTLGAKAWLVTDRRGVKFGSFGEDNPDIVSYLGNGEGYAGLGGRELGATLMVRRGSRARTETARLEAWWRPRWLFGADPGAATLYFQAFSGYGDSLIDYDRRVTRIALGVTVR